MNTNTEHPLGVQATPYAYHKSDSNLRQQDIAISLSKRETEVLQLLGLGYSIKEIGQQLFVSAHTIITHRKSIKDKCNCRKATQLAVLAERLGLLSDLKFSY